MDDSPLPAAIREQWPWRPRFARVNGWRMHYVDEGIGDPVVLLHGNPTWGFLYRDFVEPLTRAGHPCCHPRHDRVRPLGKAGSGGGAQPRRAHREPDGAAARARPSAGNPRLSRLGWADRAWLRLVEPRPRGRTRRHEYLGLAAAARRVPHADLPVADDACAARRPLPSRPPQRARRAWYLPLCCRPRKVPGARATSIRMGVVDSIAPASGSQFPPRPRRCRSLQQTAASIRSSGSSRCWSARLSRRSMCGSRRKVLPTSAERSALVSTKGHGSAQSSPLRKWS